MDVTLRKRSMHNFGQLDPTQQFDEITLYSSKKTLGRIAGWTHRGAGPGVIDRSSARKLQFPICVLVHRSSRMSLSMMRAN